MSTASEPRRAEPVTDSGDVLDTMTRAHSDMLARHGPLNRELSPRPLSPVEFDGRQARAGVALEQAPQLEKVAYTMSIEAARHEQIGRLATYVAAYEIAYGDPDDAPPLRELGRDHFGLAEGLREQLAMDRDTDDARFHQIGQHPRDEIRDEIKWDVLGLSDYVSTKTAVEVSIAQDAANRGPRSNGNEL